jgi:hypothetical protein
MIPVQTHLVDGTQTLIHQERALQFMEQAGFSRVVSYRQKPEAGATANEAALEDVPIDGVSPPPLSLVALAVGSNPAAAIAQQLTAGKNLAFQDDAFVSGALHLVLAFR